MHYYSILKPYFDTIISNNISHISCFTDFFCFLDSIPIAVYKESGQWKFTLISLSPAINSNFGRPPIGDEVLTTCSTVDVAGAETVSFFIGFASDCLGSITGIGSSGLCWMLFRLTPTILPIFDFLLPIAIMLNV